MKKAFVSGKVVTPKGIVKGSLVIEDGKISGVVSGKAKADYIEDVKGAYLLPGFFDTHLHGGGGYSGSSGRYDTKLKAFVGKEEEYPENFHQILKTHGRHGTTSMILSTATDSEDNINKFMKAGCEVINNYSSGARLLGLDIEGVFIKDTTYAGAQDPRYFRKPDEKYFDRIMKLSGWNIKRTLVAPEWGEPAVKFVKHLVRNGVVPGVGHSGASYDDFMKAYDAGVKVIIHFGNGPMSQNFKGGGVLDALFHLRGKITAELICDYHHLNPIWVSSFLKNFNFNVLGVTDSMFVLGRDDIKEFGKAGSTAVVKKDIILMKHKVNCLCGSKLSMDRAFQNFLNIFMKNLTGYLTGPLFAKPIKFDKALIEVSKLLSLNPAKLYGFDKEIGTLEKGKRADVVIMDIKKVGADYKCTVKNVIANGEIL